MEPGQEATNGGFPQNEDEAEKQLTVLFDSDAWIYDSVTSTQRALAILQRFPAMAGKQFPVHRRSRCGLVGSTVELRLPPLCHFFTSKNMDAIRAVHNINPEVVSTPCGPKGFHLMPLHVACANDKGAQKEIIAFLSEKYSGALGLPKNGTLDQTPFFKYANCFRKRHWQRLRDLDAVPEYTRVFFDMLWDDKIVERPQELYRTLCHRFELEEGNCQWLLNYVLAKVPHRSLAGNKFNHESLSQSFVHFLVALWPKYIRLECQVTNAYDDDALANLLKAPTHEKSMTLELGVSVATMEVLARCMHTNRSIRALRLFDSASAPSLGSLAASLRQNETLEELSLGLPHLPYYITAQESLDNYRAPFLVLLQNSPRRLNLGIQCDPLQRDAADGITSETLLLPTSRVEQLTLSSGVIGSRLITGESMAKLPMLSDLSILCPVLCPVGTIEIGDDLISILEQDRLKKLRVDAEFNNIGVYSRRLALASVKLNIPRLCAKLATSKTLSRLALPFLHKDDFQALSVALEKNTAIQHVQETQYFWMLGSIRATCFYLAMLNKHGRGRVRSPDMRLNDFVRLLVGAFEEQETEFGREIGPELFKTNMAYGLMRERPSLWLANTTILEKTNISGTKRKR